MTETHLPFKPDSHPTYPNPTIAEALCEIHFSLPNDEHWKPSLIGDFFKTIESDFPNMEPVIEVGVQFEFGPLQVTHSQLPPRQRMRFKHKSEQQLLQLGPNVFTFNILPKYPGWNQMGRDVLNAWTRARSALKPSKVKRIGLRYINRIDLNSPTESPSIWFKASEYLPPGALQSQGTFISRIESQIDEANRVIVTCAKIRSDGQSENHALIFDVDRIFEEDFADDDDALKKAMNRLHDHVWMIFESVQTDRLVNFLKEERK